jgi:hypothetical protein
VAQPTSITATGFTSPRERFWVVTPAGAWTRPRGDGITGPHASDHARPFSLCAAGALPKRVLHQRPELEQVERFFAPAVGYRLEELPGARSEDTPRKEYHRRRQRRRHAL